MEIGSEVDESNEVGGPIMKTGSWVAGRSRDGHHHIL